MIGPARLGAAVFSPSGEGRKDRSLAGRDPLPVHPAGCNWARGGVTLFLAMETLLILAAVAVAALALAFASAVSAQSRRPPLRTQREEDLAEGDEEGLIRSLRPAPRSPIDRTAPIVDAEWHDAAQIDAKQIEAEMIEARVIDEPSQTGKTGDRPAAPGGR